MDGKSKAAAFDIEALAEAVREAPQEAREIAATFGQGFGLACQLLSGAVAKLERVESLDEGLNSFGGGGIDIRLGSFAEGAEVVRETLADLDQAQKTAWGLFSKSMMLMEATMARGGMEASARLAAGERARKVCLAGVPERLRPGWEQLSERMALILAVQDWSDGAQPAKGSAPRL